MRATLLLEFFCLGLLLGVASTSAREAVDLAGTIDDFLNNDPTARRDSEAEDRNLIGHFGLFGNRNNAQDETSINDQELPALGQRCGLLSENTGDCQEGLECDHFSAIAGRRCAPRRQCVGETLQSFFDQPQFQGDAYKNRVMAQANLTEMDVLDALLASRDADDSSWDPSAFVASQPMQAIRSAIETTASEFVHLGPMMRRCVQPQRDERDLLSLGLLDRIRDAFGDDDDDEEEDADELLPTQGDPNQGDGQFPVVFLGIHIEAGVGFDASFSSVWQLIDGSATITQRVAGRVCGGVEIGAGFELSFIVAVGFTSDSATLNCLNILVDADIEVFFGIGAGYGFCTDPVASPTTQGMYVEVTIGTGIGGGIGFSVCRNIPFTNNRRLHV